MCNSFPCSACISARDPVIRLENKLHITNVSSTHVHTTYVYVPMLAYIEYTVNRLIISGFA